MSIPTLINILQLIISALLIVVILLQKRGSGLSGVFGGDSAVYRTKRGAEKFLFYATIGLAALFLVLAAVNVFVFSS